MTYPFRSPALPRSHSVYPKLHNSPFSDDNRREPSQAPENSLLAPELGELGDGGHWHRAYPGAE